MTELIAALAVLGFLWLVFGRLSPTIRAYVQNREPDLLLPIPPPPKLKFRDKKLKDEAINKVPEGRIKRRKITDLKEGECAWTVSHMLQVNSADQAFVPNKWLADCRPEQHSGRPINDLNSKLELCITRRNGQIIAIHEGDYTWEAEGHMFGYGHELLPVSWGNHAGLKIVKEAGEI